MINACYTGLAMSVSFARDQGLLKRTRGTPLPAWAFLFGRVAHMTAVAVVLAAAVTAAGALFYGVDVPTATLPAVVNATILPLLFISDVFTPLSDAPGWLTTLADLFPVKHLASALHTAFNPFETGAGFEPAHLAVMAAWGLGALLVSMHFFSWEPRVQRVLRLPGVRYPRTMRSRGDGAEAQRRVRDRVLDECHRAGCRST